jgi:hypothetical protein
MPALQVEAETVVISRWMWMLPDVDVDAGVGWPRHPGGKGRDVGKNDEQL